MMKKTFRDVRVIVFSFLLTAALIFGGSLSVANDLAYGFRTNAAAMRAVISAVVLFIVIMIVSNFLIQLLSSDRIRLKDQAGALKNRVLSRVFGESRSALFILWAVILICWIPCLLAYWPGILSYDMPNVLPQGDTRPYSSFHPLLYTLFVNSLYRLAGAGGNQAGVLLTSICQMMLMSLMFSYIVWRLNRMRLHPALRLVCLLWFALYPINAIFALIESKDTFFSGIFAIVTLFLIDLSRNPAQFFANRRNTIHFGILALLLCLLRNNAAYALILAVLIVFVFMRKVWKPWLKKLLIPLCCGVLGFFVLTQALFPAFGVRPGNSKEMLSVPAQQIAYTYTRHAEAFTGEELEIIHRTILMDIQRSYNPRQADPIKNYTRDWPTEEHSDGFLKVWVRLALRYPAEYIHAFLTLNLQSWYPGSPYPDPYSQRDYLETAILPDFGVVRASRAPTLLAAYEGIATRADWQKLPVVSLLFDTGVPVWIVSFGLTLAAMRGQRRQMIVFLLPLCFWITIMFGPVSNGRYAYPFLLCYPLWLCLFLATRGRNADASDAGETP